MIKEAERLLKSYEKDKENAFTPGEKHANEFKVLLSSAYSQLALAKIAERKTY